MQRARWLLFSHVTHALRIRRGKAFDIYVSSPAHRRSVRIACAASKVLSASAETLFRNYKHSLRCGQHVLLTCFAFAAE